MRIRFREAKEVGIIAQVMVAPDLDDTTNRQVIQVVPTPKRRVSRKSQVATQATKLSELERDAFEERAAIAEYDGK